jgi:hypothetical protein
MKPNRIVLLTFTLLFGIASPAMANQPPGPHTLLAELLILPIMMLFTAIGGGYAIIKKVQKKKPRRVLNILAVVLLIILSAINNGGALIVVLIFSILALARGAQMFFWGLKANLSKKIPDHLLHVNVLRLIVSGATLIITTLFLAGMSLAFFDPYSFYTSQKESGLKEYVAYQLAYSQVVKEKIGEGQFHKITNDNPAPPYINSFINNSRYNIKIDYDDAGKHFTVLMPPLIMPFFPYNYITSKPSYRADETGQIRMIRVHKKNQLCPSDAPVVMRVGPGDIQKAKLKALQFLNKE